MPWSPPIQLPLASNCRAVPRACFRWPELRSSITKQSHWQATRWDRSSRRRPRWSPTPSSFATRSSRSRTSTTGSRTYCPRGNQHPVTGGKPKQWIVVPGTQHETVSQLSGAASVSASSSGSLFVSTPGDQPLAAFLDNAAGATWEATPTDARPWIEIRFDHPIPLREITVTPSTVGTSRDHEGPSSRRTEGKRTASLEPGATPQSAVDACRQHSLLEDHDCRHAGTS